MKRITITVTATMVLLAGCAAGPYGGEPAIPAGSELVVHERIEFEPGAARAYIQNGRVVPRSEVERSAVSCYLRLQRRGEESLADAVRPESFLVIDGSRERARPARMGRGLDRDFPHAPRRYEYQTRIEIRSDQQPQVDELVCGYEDWRTGEVPTPTRIGEVLGEIASLRR